MNTKISIGNVANNSDNRIIISNKQHIDSLNAYFNLTELEIIRNAAKQGVTHLTLHHKENCSIVHLLKENPDTFQQLEDYRLAGNEILNVLNHHKIKKIDILNTNNPDCLLAYLEGMLLGNYRFVKYFSKKEDKSPSLQEITVDEKNIDPKKIAELESVIRAVYTARDLVNEPQSYLTAPQMSEEIKNIGKICGFEVTILEENQIKSLKMGGLLAVNQGSFLPPRFNILEWKPQNATNKKPIVLVGKGVVYDTGGLSLKSTPNGMDMMKSDMGGAAAVIGALMCVSMTQMPIHVVGLIPATDNRPGHNAYAPGDVITMYSGATVEVLDTDAEGRLILADALHYAKKYNPELVLDFATLTGAAQRATGHFASCVMGTASEKIKKQMSKSGFRVHERMVEFPLWKEYGALLKSNIADLKNIGGPYAGAITAGKFLEHFTDYPWMHFDIAGPAYIKSTDGYRTKEGTGVGVRLIYDFLKHYKPEEKNA